MRENEYNSNKCPNKFGKTSNHYLITPYGGEWICSPLTLMYNNMHGDHINQPTKRHLEQLNHFCIAYLHRIVAILYNDRHTPPHKCRFP